jgi:hypothetical protein
MTGMERRAHQALVDALLAEAAEERQTLYRLQAFGVRPAGARAVHEDLRRTVDRIRESVEIHGVQ